MVYLYISAASSRTIPYDEMYEMRILDKRQLAEYKLKNLENRVFVNQYLTLSWKKWRRRSIWKFERSSMNVNSSDYIYEMIANLMIWTYHLKETREKLWEQLWIKATKLSRSCFNTLGEDTRSKKESKIAMGGALKLYYCARKSKQHFVAMTTNFKIWRSIENM